MIQNVAIAQDCLNVFMASGVVVEQKPGSPHHARLLLPLVGKRNCRRTLKMNMMETVRMKKKKSGRPVKIIKKEIRASVRFSNYEYYILKEKARQAGIKVSEYLRQTAIQAKITPRLTTEEVHFVRQLAGIANNLNQVAKIGNQQGLFEAMREFEKYRNLIDTILQKLKQ